MHKPVTNKKELAWYELCMQNHTQQVKFEKLMEINFALEKMYPQNTYIMLIRSSGMGNCLFLHARGWWVDHQEQTKLQIRWVCLRWHGNRSNWTNNKMWSNSWFAITWEGGLVEGQNNIYFSQRIYMKIEFSSQRKEINGFVILDHQHGRRDVTTCIKCVEVLHDALD